MSKTLQFFEQVMKDHYQVKNLKGVTAEEFNRQINAFLNMQDGAMEGYQDPSKQRDLSIRFHWGHNHDFGSFKLEGQMRNRHLFIPSVFHDKFASLPTDLRGKKILDIGVWTGGTSLLFCGLGAQVVAIEEVKKYVDSLEYLKRAFGLTQLTVLNKSLYEMNTPEFYDQFDYVFYSGVIYHVTDPVLSLRIAFNMVKDGGKCFVETASTSDKKKTLEYEGPQIIRGGTKETLTRRGWNWFIPSVPTLAQMMYDVGFDNVQAQRVEDRAFSVGTRLQHCDMLRAGLAIRNIR